ncbi:MAG: hypothetical protein H0U21_04450, partial [Acidimicrobiia bacterium]|nr:hypothetical protein [Acidimicrobiia bacterium]
LYVHDTVLPAPPIVAGSTPSSPSNATAPSVTGPTEALATVTLFATPDCSGTMVGAGTAGLDGTFSAPVTITGTTTFRGIATDRAGNVSACSTTSFTYVYDNVMPAAPVISTTLPISPSVNDNTPIIVGDAESNSVVRIFTSADCTGTEAASSIASGGAFGIGITVASNSTTPISASSTDPAGNVSACSSSITYVHDSLVPAAPVITTATPGSPSNTNTPTIAGTTEAAATIRLYTDATCTTPIGSSVTATSGGGFAVGITVTDNTTTTLYARATDPATNVSPCSAPFSYIEDSTAPTTPSLDNLAASATSTTPTLTGSAEASSSVAIYASATCSGAVFASGTATGAGGFGIMVTVTSNTTTSFTARTTDAAGNVSACSAAIAYTHDNVAPAAPTALATTPLSPAGSNTPSVTGSAEAGSTVRLFTGPTCGTGVAGTTTATVGGTFAVSLTVPNGSTTTFYATTTDPAGNVSPCSSSFVTYTEDSTAPLAPTNLATTPTSPSSSNTPSVTGNAETGATVRLYTSATCATAVAFSGTASAGAFSIPISVGADTTTTFYATATDSAANTSTCSTASVTYVEDSIAPTVPDLAATTPASPANTNGPALTGSAESGALVKLYTSATCSTAVVASGIADALGGFSIVVTVGDNSTTTFYATATDDAGNASSCSSGRNYVEDSLAPATPSGLSTLPVSPINNSNPSITGSAETGSTVSVYTSSTCAGAAAGTGVALGGAFSIAVTVGANTTTTFYARATDGAGNQSSCSSGVSYIEDSSSPVIPVLLGTTPGSPASNASPLVNGTAEANATVRIYAGTCATLLATGTASAAGTFAILTPATANATTTLTATAI